MKRLLLAYQGYTCKLQTFLLLYGNASFCLQSSSNQLFSFIRSEIETIDEIGIICKAWMNVHIYIWMGVVHECIVTKIKPVLIRHALLLRQRISQIANIHSIIVIVVKVSVKSMPYEMPSRISGRSSFGWWDSACCAGHRKKFAVDGAWDGRWDCPYRWDGVDRACWYRETRAGGTCLSGRNGAAGTRVICRCRFCVAWALTRVYQG